MIVCIRFSACSKAMFAGALEDVLGDLDAVGQERVLRRDLGATDGLAVVERRQAVHELHPRVTRGRHQRGVHLEGQQQLDALAPRLDGSPIDTQTSVWMKSTPVDGLDRVVGDA